MHHGMLHTWPIFTITTRTGVNTQKCVRRKIQRISNFRDYCYVIIMYSSVFNQVRRRKVLYFSSYTFLCIDTQALVSGNFLLRSLFKTKYTGNLEQVPVRQNQLIVSFYEKKLVPVFWWVKSLLSQYIEPMVSPHSSILYIVLFYILLTYL
jgi:hypothetical protein